jgi:DNA-directed RNA polymerase specialized sigma24 family protein
VNLLRTIRLGGRRADEYATSEDFRKLFTEDMTRLYLLSFLLTANQQKAEQCFVDGLEDCVKGNPAFKEWARSWARRTIVKNAIRMVAPRPGRASRAFAEIDSEAGARRQPTQGQHAAIASVLGLGDFDRFAFVMLVLERYSEKECSVLLGCSQQDVREALMRASRQIVECKKHEATGQEDFIRSSSRSPEMLVH